MTILALAAPWLVLLLLWIAPTRASGVRLLPWAALPALLLAAVPLDLHRAVSIGPLVFELDATARPFLLFSALIWWLAGMYAAHWTTAGRLRFAAIWLATLGGNVALHLAADLLAFYLCFAATSLTAWGLVRCGDPPAAAHRSARLYLAMMALAEMALLTGVAAAATVDGLGFGALQPEDAGGLALTALGIGFAIKLGVLGVHVWLPPAHAVAPLPASAVLSAVLVKAGLLGWLRVAPEAPFGAAAPVLACLGLVAAYYAVGAGLLGGKPKVVLAWSTVSQVGLLVFGVAAGTLDAAALGFLAANHALAKAAAFLGIGVLAAATGVLRPVAFAGLVLASLALIGIPLTGGAASKGLLEATLTDSALPSFLAWPLALTAVATTLLMARFLIVVRLQGAPAHLGSAPAHDPRRLWPPWLILLAALLLAPWWWPSAPPLFPVTIGQIWPALLGGVLIVAVWRLRLPWPRIATRLRTRLPRPPCAPVLLRMERRFLAWPAFGKWLLLVSMALAAIVMSAP